MEKLLVVALLLGALVALSDAQCFMMAQSPDMTHCQDPMDKTWHQVGSKWRNSKCYDCDCSGCCASFSTPRNFPSDCVSVFDQQRCEYIVHKRDDPSVLCPIYGAVGK